MKNQTYHSFVTPKPIPGKATPDRCVECGNARGTQYHGPKPSYMAELFNQQAKSLRRQEAESDMVGLV